MTVRAVIFDRDGTLVVDVPYSGDPDAVQPMLGAAEAIRRLRAAGLRVAVVSNQSGVARGFITEEQVRAVNRRIDEVLGPFDAWLYCLHAPEDGCDCRKPQPKLITDAARAMGVAPSECVVIGDKESDVQSARAAGAQAIAFDGTQSLDRAVDALFA